MSVAPELKREQDYLDGARAALARMREQTLSLKVQAHDPISAEHLARTLHLRAASLQDDPSTTLFFGRIDTDQAERWYIGRRHVADLAGDPLVIDWRAQMSTAFYRASRAEPMGVTLRRRFGLDRGAITAYEDEHLQDRHEHDVRSHILAEEIERPRVGPMRDIVATIQPEQDEIVRAGADQTICVQGAPGTGKTAVGLHRAAWLLYAFRDRLARSGVLVIGPNRAFLEHIAAVLPALGEVAVGHTTVEELVASVAVRGVDSTETAVLKGDARLAEVLRYAVWSAVRPATEPLVVPRGVRKWRVPAYEVNELVDELRTRGVRYDAARQMLPQRLAHAVLLQMERAGDSPDDRVQDQVARSSVVKKYAQALWPPLDGPAVLFGLLSDPAELARHADGLLTRGRAGAPRVGAGAADQGRGSMVARRRRAARRAGRPHLTDALARVMSCWTRRRTCRRCSCAPSGRRCSTGAATVLGDIAQGTTPWATDSWETSLAHLGKPGSHVEVLDRGFRVPASVIEFAAQLLPTVAPGLGAPVSVRDNPGRLDVLEVDAADVLTRTASVVGSEAAEPGSVGVITPDDLVGALSAALSAHGVEHGVLGQDHGDIDHQVDLVPATVAKGLEFDRVVVVEPAAIVAAEPDERTGLRRLYVVLTRAVSALTVVHAEPLPAELTTDGWREAEADAKRSADGGALGDGSRV